MNEAHRAWYGRPAHELAGRPASIVPVPSLIEGQLLVGGRGVLRGWSLLAAAATNLTYAVYDGMDANGTLIHEDTVTEATTDIHWFGGPGIDLTVGAYLSITAGTALGSFWIAYLTPADTWLAAEHHGQHEGNGRVVR